MISDELRYLQKELKESTVSAFAVGTSKNLRTQWESFVLFCIYFKLCFLPASTSTLQLYAQFLSRSFTSVDSIKNYISGVKTMHSIVGLSVDHINNYLLNLSLKGISRLKPRQVKRAAPITIEILLDIYKDIDFSKPENIVYWCLFLFAFFLLARKSNLVPTSQQDIENKRFLAIKDIKYFDNYILVHINWSKTIQFKEREIICPLIRMKDSRICPVTAFERLMVLKIKFCNGALFTLPSGSCITYQLFQKKLRSCLNNIGLEAKQYSSHSFRRGFTTLAFQSDIPPEHIQLLGDWKSDAYKSYLVLGWGDKMKILNQIFEKI